MADKPKNSDKPREPAYSGGEDEGNEKSQPQPSEPPLDESDEGPGA
jgi:hypothetical protein